jgi:hypothetical protein
MRIRIDRKPNHRLVVLSGVDQEMTDRIQRRPKGAEHLHLRIRSDPHLDPQVKSIGMMDQVCRPTVRRVTHHNTVVESRIVGPACAHVGSRLPRGRAIRAPVPVRGVKAPGAGCWAWTKVPRKRFQRGCVVNLVIGHPCAGRCRGSCYGRGVWGVSGEG